LIINYEVEMKTWNEKEKAELANLYHLARTALAGKDKKDTPYERKLWASKEYSKLYPEISSTAAYKELCRQSEWRFSK